MQNVRPLALAFAATLFLGLSATIVKAQPAATQPDDRRAQMRARMEKAAQDALGATDDEWKVLQPRIEKVRTLQQQSRAGGGMGRAGFMAGGAGGQGGPGGRGGRRGRNNNPENADNNNPAPAAAAERPQSAVAKAQSELNEVLKNKDATPDQIKSKLDALRKARDTAKTDLVAAQKDLRDIVNLRQEATLVTMGLLD